MKFSDHRNLAPGISAPLHSLQQHHMARVDPTVTTQWGLSATYATVLQNPLQWWEKMK